MLGEVSIYFLQRDIAKVRLKQSTTRAIFKQAVNLPASPYLNSLAGEDISQALSADMVMHDTHCSIHVHGDIFIEQSGH